MSRNRLWVLRYGLNSLWSIHSRTYNLHVIPFVSGVSRYMGRLKSKSISSLVAILLLILISTISSLIIYFTYQGSLGEMQENVQVIRGFIKVEAVGPGIGYVKLYIRSVDFEGKIDVVYFLDPGDYTVLAFTRLIQPVELSAGELVEVTIPLILAEYFQPLKDALSRPVLVGVGVYSSSGIAILAVSRETVNLAPYLREAIRALIGFIAERDYGGGRLDINPEKIHYVKINLITGEYEFIYIDGPNDVRRATGYAKVFKDINVLDLRKLSWEERYALGPVVVFINPHFAVKDYEVTIINTGGGVIRIPVKKLVDDKRLVGLDAIACWEDLWWPNTGASLDDYRDHVVRITVFTNNTIRIEVIHTAAGYIHVFFIKPPPADREKLKNLVNQYMNNNYMLPPETGVVYVKAHDVSIPPLDPHDLWDPVKGEWITRWPLVFYR